jgi:hypothetical protein
MTWPGSGNLPPRRPDQQSLPAPRGTTPGARITRLGGTPGSKSAVGAGAQVPTAFYTFPQAGRLFAAEISFAVGTNASYSASVTQLYATVSTLSGLNLGTVELAVAAPSQAVNGQGGLTLPDAGVPVAAGDKLRLDVNNGASLGIGGVMRATCEVFFTLP